jgi:signal peptidase II
MKNKRLYISLGIIFLILLLDQLIKIWIKTHMMLGEEIHVANWFIIHFTENPGMAFGMEFGGNYGKLILSLFRIIAIGAMFWYLIKSIKQGINMYFVVAFSLIISGALGNLIDSAFYGLIFDHSMHQIATLFPSGGGYGSFLHGRVVDMFYFPIISGHFPSWFPIIGNNHFTFFNPVFNFADAAISSGVIFLILFYKRAFPKPIKENKKTNSEIESDSID